MDIEVRLRKLEARYRAAESAAAAAKAHYLALSSQDCAKRAALDGAKALWVRLDGRKQEIAAQMGEVEALT
jgi:hypothetical protein